VQSEQDKINALSNDLANSMLAFRIDFNENLTAEQRKQMKEMRAKLGGEEAWPWSPSTQQLSC
jgi:Spy/CpxP family protein refolding chaperone